MVSKIKTATGRLVQRFAPRMQAHAYCATLGVESCNKCMDGWSYYRDVVVCNGVVSRSDCYAHYWC